MKFFDIYINSNNNFYEAFPTVCHGQVFFPILITFSARIGIYPSPFIFSPETPINTGVLEMKGKKSPFITCHLNVISAFIEDCS